jgi:hypothetical protein
MLKLLFIFLFFTSCKESSPEIEPSRVDIQIIRFEKELFNIDIYNIQNEANKLAQQYPDFFSLYTNKIIDIGNISQDWFVDALSTFITDQAIYEISDRTNKVFNDINELVPALELNFGRFKSIFPQNQIPVIYTYISGFNQNIVISENLLGISLEKYLGADEPLYDKVYPPIGKYQRQNMYPEKIPSDALKAWIQSEFEYKPEQDNLISRMLYEGRTMYLLDVLQPGLADTALWGYTESKYRFCAENEKQMWKYLIENKLLFNSDHFRITQFINDAPFTKDFSKDSPGRAAVWLGYKIVEKYKNRNPDVSIQELMQETNFQKILNDSKYRPE